MKTVVMQNPPKYRKVKDLQFGDVFCFPEGHPRGEVPHVVTGDGVYLVILSDVVNRTFDLDGFLGGDTEVRHIGSLRSPL